MEAKLIIIGGIALTAAAVGFGLYRAARTGMKLELDIEPKLRRLDFAGLQVEVDASFKNPTKGSITLRNPLIRLLLPDSGQELMQADLSDQDIGGRD